MDKIVKEAGHPWWIAKIAYELQFEVQFWKKEGLHPPRNCSETCWDWLQRKRLLSFCSDLTEGHFGTKRANAVCQLAFGILSAAKAQRLLDKLDSEERTEKCVNEGNTGMK